MEAHFGYAGAGPPMSPGIQMRGFWGKYVRATSLLTLASIVPSGYSVLLPSLFLLSGAVYRTNHLDRLLFGHEAQGLCVPGRPTIVFDL
jgi:hypothetical protein